MATLPRFSSAAGARRGVQAAGTSRGLKKNLLPRRSLVRRPRYAARARAGVMSVLPQILEIPLTGPGPLCPHDHYVSASGIGIKCMHGRSLHNCNERNVLV